MTAVFDKIQRFSFKLHKVNIKGFLRSLITILKSKMRNSKWRIEYSGHFLLNSTFFA